jgi:hypothetical protein
MLRRHFARVARLDAAPGNVVQVKFEAELAGFVHFFRIHLDFVGCGVAGKTAERHHGADEQAKRQSKLSSKLSSKRQARSWHCGNSRYH